MDLLIAALDVSIKERGLIKTIQVVGEYMKPLFFSQNKILEIYLGSIEGISKE